MASTSWIHGVNPCDARGRQMVPQREHVLVSGHGRTGGPVACGRWRPFEPTGRPGLRGRERPERSGVMDFEDGPEDAAFRAEARAFLEANATPKTGTDTDWSRGAVAEDPDD